MASTPVVGAAAGGAAGSTLTGSSQTRFTVDPDQAQKLIDGLNDAIKELNDLRSKSDALGVTQPPGKDPYSGYATVAIRNAAGQSPGGYGWANQEAIKALKTTRDNVQAALNTYRGLDSSGRNTLSSGG